MNARWVVPVVGLLLAAVIAGCSNAGPKASTSPTGTPRPQARATATPSPTPTPVPTPPLPAYAIESLRHRAFPGGTIQIGAPMFRGDGFMKYQMSWPSQGQTMTGTISMPDGPGPFPVVVVNHGFIRPDRYWVGQDSGIFGDPMASHGFISLAPNWPNYAGSGPGPADLPPIAQELAATLDLVSSLPSIQQADRAKVALVGHSNGGGISQLAMVVDERVKAVVLHGPISSDMADNARKWWMTTPGGAGPMGSPDQNPTGYAQMSPRNYFAGGDPPTLIIQGTADHSIPADWANATETALQAKGIQTRLSWYQGADHDFVGADLARAVAEQEQWIRQVMGLP